MQNVFTQGPSAQLSGTEPKYWCWVLRKRCVHIGAQLRNRTQAPCPGTKCEHCLRVTLGDS